jgi:hypothetical protein
MTDLITTPAGANHKNITVYIYNVVEDEWSFVNAYSDSVRLVEDIEHMENTSDCFFLAMAAAETEFIYISAKPIAVEFQAYAQTLGKYKNGIIINPDAKTHQLCLDLLEDQTAFNQLVNLLKNFQQVTLLSYSASPQFYQLKAALIKVGLNVRTPESPSLDSAWTVNFFGSKSGIRQLAQQSAAAEPDFIMPDGLICVGRFDASRIAAHKYLKNRGVVIKTNKGSGGNGVLIFRDNDLPNDYQACVRKLETILSHERYWEMFPIVVEDLVNVNLAFGEGFPNVEFKIWKNGRIEMLFHGILAVTAKGEYYGMDVNADILPHRLKTGMLDTGYFIAERYAAAGYRGHFDIDMMVAKNGRLYVSESNTRNTGWTDVYKIVRKLIGPDWLNRVYVLSREDFRLTKNRWTNLDNLLEALSPLLYSHQTHSGIIINSENSLKRKYLYYTIIAPNKKSAYEYQEKMTHLLANGRHNLNSTPALC